ncbi:MAG: ABC-type nitrate/sulfonate/bicarbonate transport system substrate-binding protein [Verrucomicrobiales bacterium]|jgi:ABC-type nitrate/sulfonate/bicarbonate transport system substrate-binding protein
MAHIVLAQNALKDSLTTEFSKIKRSPIMNLKSRHAILTIATSLLIVGAAQAENQKLVVGHDLWIGYAGAFVAKDKGFFKEAGLDVEFKQFPGPADTLPALISGKLDIGLTTLHKETSSRSLK